ncbi:hypothetical protein SBA4_1170011 [Candidatus Sulfopaludibacter sp. SbA4]|nr:hypothetical protein SBA4_1170011 [Candidatus Sulfopaludibacter sp. SbA4]
MFGTRSEECSSSASHSIGTEIIAGQPAAGKTRRGRRLPTVYRLRIPSRLRTTLRTPSGTAIGLYASGASDETTSRAVGRLLGVARYPCSSPVLFFMAKPTICPGELMEHRFFLSEYHTFEERIALDNWIVPHCRNSPSCAAPPQEQQRTQLPPCKATTP